MSNTYGCVLEDFNVNCDDVGMNGSQALQYMTDILSLDYSKIRERKGVGPPSLHVYQMPHPDFTTYQVLALGHVGLKIKWKLLAKFKD